MCKAVTPCMCPVAHAALACKHGVHSKTQWCWSMLALVTTAVHVCQVTRLGRCDCCRGYLFQGELAKGIDGVLPGCSCSWHCDRQSTERRELQPFATQLPSFLHTASSQTRSQQVGLSCYQCCPLGVERISAAEADILEHTLPQQL